MRTLRFGLVFGALLAAGARAALAQPPGDPFHQAVRSPPSAVLPAANSAPAPAPTDPQASAAENCESDLARRDTRRKEQAALKAGAQDDEQKKRIELLQKQVETLEKMVRLLADQL